jgi:hypothetical protein
VENDGGWQEIRRMRVRGTGEKKSQKEG